MPAAERIRLRLALDHGADAVLERLLAAGYHSVWSEELFPPGAVAGETALAGTCVYADLPVAQAAGFRDLAAAICFEMGLAASISSAAAAPAEDWESAWRQFWKPFRCAGFVVAPEWVDRARAPWRAADRWLWLARGSAFGTGQHPSTRLALRLLAPAGAATAATALDVGTGSGILACAAALLGAHGVAGMDPEPSSARQAAASAAANGVAEKCHFWTGTLESAAGAWPLVLANLEGTWHRRHGALAASLLTSGGCLVASGVRASEALLVEAEYRSHGLLAERILASGRWRAWVWRKG